MATVKVVPRSLTDAYKRREGDFSPNLVGLQFTDGASLFTFGNFQITTTISPKLNKNFVLGGQWSDYYSLDNLNISESESEILVSNEIFVRLNFDPKKIDRYIYFGSFHEYARVTIEQIIQKWKGSLYLNPTTKSNFPLNTVLSFSYNSGNDTANFLIPKSVVSNPFELIVDANTDFFDLLPTDIFNLSRDYKKYDISNEIGSFKIIGYTGSTTTYDYINIITSGNPFPTLTATTFGQYTYHVKPNEVEVQMFFEQLNDFEKVLLNRLTTPIYTSTFSVPTEVEGNILYVDRNFNWPVTDGYNLDINTRDYGLYVEDILAVATLFDENKTDLMARRFVSESIHEFDTNGGTVVGLGEDTYGRKVNKLLRIYGREYDEVKKYIDGISFANVVTYNKLDNTSDELIKIMAKTLGFDVLLTVGTDNFNLLQQIQPSYHTPFSGYSRSLSSMELDIELWRRLVINAWWLFRSKGTRKVIEFFFNLFKIPQCMVTLNEYIYLAENRLDTEKVYDEIVKIYELSGVPSDTVRLSAFPMDDYGFPKPLQETQVNYFQMNGFWYNGGTEITTGNNPHIGPYDFGKSYFDQFQCFIPNFNDFLTASTLVTVTKNYFNNYNQGTFIFDQNGLPVPYYGNGYANILNNNNLVDNVVVNSAGLTYVGGNNAPKYGRPSGDTYSMKVSFTAGNKTVCDPCAAYQLTFGAEDGIIYVVGNPNKPLTNQLCCKGYWLPTAISTPVCPNVADLMISINGEVLDFNTGQSISQACCSKAILGFDVAWDGKGCIIPQNCPNPADLQITIGGVILDSNTNQTITEQCCTESNLGFAVVWNGKECITSSGGQVGGGGGTPTGTFRTYSPNELFQKAIDTSVNPTPISNYTCYWCPPANYTQTICSMDDYLATSTDAQIIQFAINLGAPPNISVNNAITFISNIYTPFFNTYGCIILDNQDKMIKDSACCTLRGGTLTNINGVNYCIKGSSNPCAGAQIAIRTHVWTTANNTLLPQSCCNQAGQYWISPTSSNGNNITLTSQAGVTTFLDIPGSTFAGQTSYCSSCPGNIIEVVASTGIFITDSNNNMLPQQCCVDYGFNWDQNTNQCSKCPTVVNYGTPLDDTVITDLNGNDLTQQCCQAVGGWYGNAFNQGNRCYICPGVMIWDGSGSPTSGTPNPDYIYVGNEITYQGTSLSQTCCTQYNAQFGGVTWNAIENKCLNNNMGAGGGTSTSQPFEIIIGDASCGTLSNNIILSPPVHDAWVKQFGIIVQNDSLPGYPITVYVPIGQTPINSTLYLDANLSIMLSPSNKGFTSPTGSWYISFRYNNDVYLLNYGSVNWLQGVNQFPTAVYKGAVGSPCTGTVN